MSSQRSVMYIYIYIQYIYIYIYTYIQYVYKRTFSHISNFLGWWLGLVVGPELVDMEEWLMISEGKDCKFVDFKVRRVGILSEIWASTLGTQCMGTPRNE